MCFDHHQIHQICRHHQTIRTSCRSYNSSCKEISKRKFTTLLSTRPKINLVCNITTHTSFQADFCGKCEGFYSKYIAENDEDEIDAAQQVARKWVRDVRSVQGYEGPLTPVWDREGRKVLLIKDWDGKGFVCMEVQKISETVDDDCQSILIGMTLSDESFISYSRREETSSSCSSDETACNVETSPRQVVGSIKDMGCKEISLPRAKTVRNLSKPLPHLPKPEPDLNKPLPAYLPQINVPKHLSWENESAISPKTLNPPRRPDLDRARTALITRKPVPSPRSQKIEEEDPESVLWVKYRREVLQKLKSKNYHSKLAPLQECR